MKVTPEKTPCHATRNIYVIPLIKTKLNLFKNTFIPSAIIEWNKLDPTIRNTQSFGLFKNNIFKFIRPSPRRFFSCYNHKEIRLMTSLRLVLSRLREHKFNHNQSILFVVVVWTSNEYLTFLIGTNESS